MNQDPTRWYKGKPGLIQPGSLCGGWWGQPSVTDRVAVVKDGRAHVLTDASDLGVRVEDLWLDLSDLVTAAIAVTMYTEVDVGPRADRRERQLLCTVVLCEALRNRDSEMRGIRELAHGLWLYSDQVLCGARVMAGGFTVADLRVSLDWAAAVLLQPAEVP